MLRRRLSAWLLWGCVGAIAGVSGCASPPGSSEPAGEGASGAGAPSVAAVARRLPSTSDEAFFTSGPRARARAGVELRVLPGRADDLVLEVDVTGVELGHAELHGRAFTTVDVAGSGTTGALGRPRLPVIRRFVELPLGATARVEVEPLEVRRARLPALGLTAPVLPVQRPVEKLPGAAAAAELLFDPAAYGEAEPYPAGTGAALEGPLVMRGHALWVLSYTPVRYRPGTGELDVVAHARLRVQVERRGVARASPDASRRDSPSFARWLEANVVNAPSASRLDQGGGRRFAEGVLFIVGDAFASHPLLASYVELRRSEGHRVEVVTATEAGPSPADVRRYVQRQYRTWQEPALRYVVLVGDVEAVPTFKGHGGGKAQATDLYYASIDPDDYPADLLAPELVVSRVSVNDTAELETYLTRATRYVGADFGAASKAWMKKLSFLASCDRSSTTEGTHDAVAEAHTTKAGFTGIYPVDPQLGGDRLYCRPGLTKAAITRALGDGRSIINFSGHGAPEAWADPPYGAADLADVAPAGAIPFVVSNACVTGSFADASDCWGEQWLAHPRGAIVYWGASNNSYWDEDDILERALWDGVFAGGITRIGDAIANAKAKTLLHYGANDTMEYYYEMYNMLGDATVDLYTDVDFELRAQHPTVLALGVDTLELDVAGPGGPVRGALVSVRGDGVQQVGSTDERGHLALRLSPPPARPGALQLVVTAHNGRRYDASVEIIAAAGPYLAYASHRVTSDGVTDTAPGPGRRLVLPVELQNHGQAVATAVSARLSSSSPDVAVVQAEATFDDIAAGARGRSLQHFAVELSASAQDRAVIPLRLDWTTGSGASGSARFAVTVERPRLVYVLHRVDDAAGGCDADGIPDVGERAQLAVTVQNVGSGRASGVRATLSCAGCGVGAQAALPALGAGEAWTPTFDVVVPASSSCPAPALPFALTASADELPTPERLEFVQRANADVERSTFADDVVPESATSGWTHGAVAGADDWAVVSTDAHSPGTSWFVSAPGSAKDAALLTPPLALGERSTLRFFHRFDLEARFDGAVLEVSLDGGATFRDLGSLLEANGYGETMSGSSSSPLAGRRAWSGASGGWKETTVDLSSLGPGQAVVRFRLVTDDSVAGRGWWIDDVRFESETVVCQRRVCGAQ